MKQGITFEEKIDYNGVKITQGGYIDKDLKDYIDAITTEKTE